MAWKAQLPTTRSGAVPSDTTEARANRDCGKARRHLDRTAAQHRPVFRVGQAARAQRLECCHSGLPEDCHQCRRNGCCASRTPAVGDLPQRRKGSGQQPRRGTTLVRPSPGLGCDAAGLEARAGSSNSADRADGANGADTAACCARAGFHANPHANPDPRTQRDPHASGTVPSRLASDGSAAVVYDRATGRIAECSRHFRSAAAAGCSA